MAHQTAGPLVTLRVGAQGLHAGQQVGVGLQLGLSVQPAMPGQLHGRADHHRHPAAQRWQVTAPTALHALGGDRQHRHAGPQCDKAGARAGRAGLPRRGAMAFSGSGSGNTRLVMARSAMVSDDTA